VVPRTLDFACDFAFDNVPFVVRGLKTVDALLVLGLLLGRVDRPLFLVDVGYEHFDVLALLDLAAGAERGQLRHRKDSFGLVSDVDEDLVVAHLNDSPGDGVSAAVRLDVAFRESVLHLYLLFHAPLPDPNFASRRALRRPARFLKVHLTLIMLDPRTS